MAKIKIGDIVTVVNDVKNYSAYSDKFKEMGFKDAKSDHEFMPNQKCKEFKVFAKSRYNRSRVKLYGIENLLGEQYLFSKGGLKLL